jgi:hypothetical protein
MSLIARRAAVNCPSGGAALFEQETVASAVEFKQLMFARRHQLP